jgi:hypothetical protein
VRTCARKPSLVHSMGAKEPQDTRSSALLSACPIHGRAWFRVRPYCFVVLGYVLGMPRERPAGTGALSSFHSLPQRWIALRGHIYIVDNYQAQNAAAVGQPIRWDLDGRNG